MNTHFLAALALVTLATACDLEAAPSPADESTFRDGEVIVPPTGPIGTGFLGKGGYDNPEEILLQSYDKVPVEYQLAFEQGLEKQAVAVIEAEFLANERNLEECPWSCETLGASWNEGVYIADLLVTHGEVWTEEGRTEGGTEEKGGTEHEGGLHWATQVEVSAQVGCGCI